MNCRSLLSLIAIVGAMGLCACGSAAPPAASSTQSGSGVKAFIDPATGELRQPTEAEQNAAAAAAASRTAASVSASVKATAPIEGKPIGNGVTQFDVGERGMIDEVACVGVDGTISAKCPKATK
jgi:predicted lipoprotein